ncbi:MAG: hypothetical protein V7607_6232 [Solirubrobacteraceae bacterium]
MSATDAARASRATPGTVPAGVPGQRGVALERHEISLGTVLFVDVRVRSLLLGEARKRVVTGAFGIPRGDQSFLVRMILIGAVATVLRDLAPRPWPRPSGADAAMGGSVLNATLRGIAGAPSRNMPIAGALIAFGLLSRSLRPAIAGSAREVHALARKVRSAFDARYGQ